MTDLIPPNGNSGRPSRHSARRRLSKRGRIGVLFAALVMIAVLAFFFWRDALFGFLVYLLYIFLFLHFPVSAFACLAAIVFAVGWYLCPWPSRLRRKRWWPASTVLAVVFVLHAGWFLFGWVTFYPTCDFDPGVGLTTGRWTMVGELAPAFADAMERGLTDTWGSAAVRRANEHVVLVRPVFGLLTSERHAELSFFLSNGSELPGPLADWETGCGSVERNAMRGGAATGWRADWGLWPWSTIHDNGDFARWLRGLYKDA